jgi:NAD(P)-dependent dehydrogenase (short-subunit alcohol dehydrogenase family)
MVKYNDVRAVNTSYFTSASTPSDLTAVFVGATAGIGYGALRALLKHTAAHTPPLAPTIYILGRTAAKLSPLFTELQTLNTAATLIPIESGDLSSISNAQKAATKILETSAKLDLLIMSPGYITMARDDNGEGVDRVTALRHYSRAQILVTLAPLLRKAVHPRVVTVQAGGKEGAIPADDLLFKSGYSVAKAAAAGPAYITLFLEEFAQQPENEKISLIHAYPGIVAGTGLRLDGLPFWLGWVASVASFLLNVIGYSLDESGERILYSATSPLFLSAAEAREGGDAAKGSTGEVGTGVYLVDGDDSVIAGTAVLTGHRAKELGERVYTHTLKVLSDIEATGHTE